MSLQSSFFTTPAHVRILARSVSHPCTRMRAADLRLGDRSSIHISILEAIKQATVLLSDTHRQRSERKRIMTSGVIAPLPHRASHLQAVHLYADGRIWGIGLNHSPRHWFTLTVLNLLLPGGELYSRSRSPSHATWFLARSGGDLHPAIFPLHTTWSQNWNSIWLHVFTLDCLLGY